MDPVLDFLFDQTHPAYLARFIEEPIDRALQDFLYLPEPVFFSRYFHRVVAELMRHLIRRCGRVLNDPTLEQALEEGLMLLEHRYSGPAGRGYEAALVDAAGEGGIDSVLFQIGVIYKERARSDHLQFLFHRYYFSLEPRRRCKVVQNLMTAYDPRLSPKLRQVEPVALIEDLPALIFALQGVEGDLQTLLTAGI
jgi:hypothetical protein